MRTRLLCVLFVWACCLDARGVSAQTTPPGPIAQPTQTSNPLNGLEFDDGSVTAFAGFFENDLLADTGPGAVVPVASIMAAHLGLDAAIASLSPTVAAQNVALVSGVHLLPPVVPAINDVLEKSGRTTGITRARIQGIGTFNNVFPAIHLRPLLGGMGTVISDRGDSGAVWYSATSSAAVGLHVAGDNSGANPFAIAAVLTEVVRGLRLTWVQVP